MRGHPASDHPLCQGSPIGLGKGVGYAFPQTVMMVVKFAGMGSGMPQKSGLQMFDGVFCQAQFASSLTRKPLGKVPIRALTEGQGKTDLQVRTVNQ